MGNLIKTLDSGAKLEIQLASFENGHRLLKAIMKEVEGIEINAGLNTEINLSVIKNIVAKIIYSENIESALWACMNVVLYDGKKVSRETFEDENARADFLIVTKEVLVYNLTPFFKNLGSALSAIQEKFTNIQKSK